MSKNLYRMNGKIVNSIELESYLDNNWNNNYVQENKYGINSTPYIYSKQATQSVFAYVDTIKVPCEGWAQIKVLLYSTGILSINPVIDIKIMNEFDEEVNHEELESFDDFPRIIGLTYNFEYYCKVKKNWKIQIQIVNLTTIDNYKINEYIRIHPSLFNENEENYNSKIKKMNNLVKNKIGLESYYNNEWIPGNLNNKYGINGNVFGLFAKNNNELIFPINGLLELSILVATLYTVLPSFIEINILDENDVIIKSYFITNYEPILRPNLFALNYKIILEIKKNWKIKINNSINIYNFLKISYLINTSYYLQEGENEKI